jgi:formylglycine-generating enzyme required for sulfatase activity
MPTLFDAFISYGRKDSKDFATKLYNRLTEQGFKIWFDQNDIPLAVNFPKQIKDGIEKSHNFIYLIAPSAVKSKHCRKEIDLAVQLNKRIIPLMHVAPEDCWEQMPPVINKLNQLFSRQDKLDKGEIEFEAIFADLVEVLTRQANYVEQQTRLLVAALEWQNNHKQTRFLLIGQERQEAVEWLEKHFENEQPPCLPTDLHCEFICESTKNANSLMTQVFISYALEDKPFVQKLRQTLMRYHITVWADKAHFEDKANFDFQTREEFQEEVKEHIEEADNFIYLMSPDSVSSQLCEQQLAHAVALNKRVIALILAETDFATSPSAAKNLSQCDLYIDFTQRLEFYHKSADKLLDELHNDAQYYEQHKILLVKALKWQRQNYNRSLLLRGYNLEHFEAWLKTAQQRQIHPPLPLHEHFVHESRQQLPEAALDIFISYSQTDSDLARKLNEAFQSQGKTTWFDQESLAVGDNFKEEIHRGIEQCDNFLFIISPSSINSPFCADEVEYAHNLNKRITTVLHRPVKPEELHPVLENIEWIDFNRYKGHFLTNFNEFVRVLETDREHVRNHTKWTLRALDWQNAGRSPDLLLRGNEFATAEDWLLAAKQKQPTPSDLQQELIRESRIAIKAAEKQEQRKLEELVESRTAELRAQLSAAHTKRETCFVATLALIIMMAMVWYASEKTQIAQQAQTDAKQQEQLAQQAQKRAKDSEKQARRTQIYDEKNWKVFRDRLKDGSEGPKMVWIPAGTFRMGDIQNGGDRDEQPVHEVSVERFAMSRYEITHAEFVRFLNAVKREGSQEKPWFETKAEDADSHIVGSTGNFQVEAGYENHPMIRISWYGATAYAEWLSEQTGQEYRLPTEAEWEYAARAGTETSRYWGNAPDGACRYANVHDNTSKEENGFSWTNHNCTDGYAKTAPVGRFEPNAFGLFDMLGNVWEWTCSEYEREYRGKEPHCVKSAGRFAARGASWDSRAGRARSANRSWDAPTTRLVGLGVRLVRMP